MLGHMRPYTCDNQEQICRCDLCTRRVRTVITESPYASPPDDGALEAGMDWVMVGLPNRQPERLVPRK
jgi:hypothetical protein